MENTEISNRPSALSLLVDPAMAMQAAQRLYAARGQGICHSGWWGRTVPLGQAGLPQDAADDDDGSDD